MARNFRFPGCNRHFLTTDRNDDGSPTGRLDWWGFTNGNYTYTAWKLSVEELAEINRTGVIMVAERTLGEHMRQHFVGSRLDVLRDTADFGRLWSRPQGPVPTNPINPLEPS